MADLAASQIVFLAGVIVFTLVAAISDIRTRKIPNKMTVPMCVCGFIYQACFFQLDGLLSGFSGFLTGFGVLFLLWMIGTAGGGDVKLMGALGPWLGAGMTFKVLFCAFLFVAVGTFSIVVYSAFSNGFRKTKSHYLRSNSGTETAGERQKRRVMAFAAPVALATWCVIAIQFLIDRGV